MTNEQTLIAALRAAEERAQNALASGNETAHRIHTDRADAIRSDLKAISA